MTDISPDIFNQVLLEMSSDKNKASAEELKNQIELYEREAKKKRNVSKSEENPNGMLIRPEMGGKIVLSILQKGEGHIDHVCAELDEQGVEQPMPLAEMKWKEVIDQLRMDEYHSLVELELARDIEHWSKVTQIEPHLDKMIELFEYQEDYFLQRQQKQKSL